MSNRLFWRCTASSKREMSFLSPSGHSSKKPWLRICVLASLGVLTSENLITLTGKSPFTSRKMWAGTAKTRRVPEEGGKGDEMCSSMDRGWCYWNGMFTSPFLIYCLVAKCILLRRERLLAICISSSNQDTSSTHDRPVRPTILARMCPWNMVTGAW